MCPTCGKWLDASEGVTVTGTIQIEEEKLPKEGDVTICMGCATVLRFGKNLQVENLTGEDLNNIKKDPHVRKLIETTRLAVELAKEYVKDQEHGTEIDLN
jgi:hypothetical protein